MEFGVTPQGYHYVRGEDGGTTTIHRLVAVAEYGYEAVAGKDVHHKDGVLCLNSRENIEPVSKEDHTRKHIEAEYGDRAYRDEDVLRELYVERGLSTTQVAERLDCSYQTVNNWLRKCGIELSEAGSPWDKRSGDTTLAEGDV